MVDVCTARYLFVGSLDFFLQTFVFDRLRAEGFLGLCELNLNVSEAVLQLFVFYLTEAQQLDVFGFRASLGLNAQSFSGGQALIH